MRELGFITPEKCTAAQAEDVAIGSRQSAQGQTYAVEYIRQQVIAAVGWDRAMNEGFRIRTTIDADLQKVAEESLRTHLEKIEQTPGYAHETYEVLRDQFPRGEESWHDRHAWPRPNICRAPSLPWIIKLAAFSRWLAGGISSTINMTARCRRNGRRARPLRRLFSRRLSRKDLFPGTVVEDSALDNRAVMIGGTTGILGEWGPEREDNRYEGPITAREALAKSKNGATVRLGMLAGVDAVVQLCKAGGIKTPLRPYPATFLGSSEVTLADLALAYTSFPNGGWRPGAPFILDRIEEKNGKVVWESTHESKRVIR